AGRALPVHPQETPGDRPSRHLPPSQRLGLRPQRPENPLRRILHVGRLSRHGADSTHQAGSGRRPVSPVLSL
ncbi:uncharacterized protein METZ01_LOCUS257073, partial [marine metagenome]